MSGFFCLHQAVERARVGPSDYTFRHGDDVVPSADLPPEVDAVLAGHIHRRQILVHRRPDGSSLPIVYPGAIERTSFAERCEPKGYFALTVGDASPGGRRHLDFEFVPLPARPMEDLVLGNDIDPRGVREFLQAGLAGLDPDSIVRLRRVEGLSSAVRTAVTGKMLREVCPATMNLQFGAGFFSRPPRGRG